MSDPPQNLRRPRSSENSRSAWEERRTQLLEAQRKLREEEALVSEQLRQLESKRTQIQWNVKEVTQLIARFAGLSTYPKTENDWDRAPDGFQMAQISRTHRDDLRPILTPKHRTEERVDRLMHSFRQANAFQLNAHFQGGEWDTVPPLEEFPDPAISIESSWMFGPFYEGGPPDIVLQAWNSFLLKTYAWDDAELKRRWDRLMRLEERAFSDADDENENLEPPSFSTNLPGYLYTLFDHYRPETREDSTTMEEQFWRLLVAAALAYGPAALVCIKWLLLQNKQILFVIPSFDQPDEGPFALAQIWTIAHPGANLYEMYHGGPHLGGVYSQSELQFLLDESELPPQKQPDLQPFVLQ